MDPVIETLQRSTPYTILGANISQSDFDKAWVSLLPEVQGKLSGACSRIQLVDTLLHEARLPGPWEQVQSEALQVYLLSTCFDALAGQDYKQFHEWVKSEEQNDIVAREIATAAGPSLLQWYRAVTQRLAEAWLEIYGVTKNYRELFFELPEVLRRELVQAYAVIKEPKETLKDWGTWPEDRRLKRVTEYLYRLRRNTFTHEAKISPTVHPETGVSGTVLFIPPGFWDYSVYFLNPDDIRGEVSLLRIIAIGKMREMLGYEIDQAFLDLHWEIERYHQQFRALRTELARNERASFKLMREQSPDLTSDPHRGLWKLSGDTAKTLQTRQNINLAWFGADDRQVRELLSAYIEAIRSINRAIATYEQVARTPEVSSDTKNVAYGSILQAISDVQLQNLLVQLAMSLDAMLDTAPQIVRGS